MKLNVRLNNLKTSILSGLMFLSYSLSATETWVAYNVLVDAEQQDYEVFIMDMEGENQRNISNHSGVDWVYYAVGDRLYFLSDRDQCHRCFYLYEMDGRGENLRQVTDFYMADSWFGSRHHGTELIVKPKNDDQADFYVIDLQGQIKQRIDLDFAYVNDPAFSPDGKQVVFRAADVKSPKQAGFADELYVSALDDIKPRQLTHHPQHNTQQKWSGYLAATPRWRNDGLISYATFIAGQYDIYTIAADGSNRQQVTHKPGHQVYHDWLADGTLVYESSANNHSGYDIFLQQPDGTIKQLTHDDFEQYAPVFVTLPKQAVTTKPKSRQ